MRERVKGEGGGRIWEGKGEGEVRKGEGKVSGRE